MQCKLDIFKLKFKSNICTQTLKMTISGAQMQAYNQVPEVIKIIKAT